MANSHILGNSLIVTGSVTASQGFYGDGSGLTNITASAEWDGSRNGDASITGSLVVSGSGAVVNFTNVVTNLTTTNISGSLTITGSLSNGIYTVASGEYSHAEGYSTEATGSYSHAEGNSTTAFGDYSHAEGYAAHARGDYSHAEGEATETTGEASHAEGYTSEAHGFASHAEGESTDARGTGAHAEGDSTEAIGDYSHAEGSSTQTGTQNAYYAQDITSGSITLSGSYGDVAIQFTTNNRLYLYDTPFDDNYSRGVYSISQSYFSSSNTVVELYDNSVTTTTAYVGDIDSGILTWTGDQTIPGPSSHAEGYQTIALADNSHAEGFTTVAIGERSHAEGESTEASGDASHAEGFTTVARGEYSHAEGEDTQAVSYGSHAEGYLTIASGSYSHAEGYDTEARANASHAEGYNTIALGSYSHAEGSQTIASGSYSHAEGLGTITQGDYQHVQGQYNISSSVQSAFIIGNGVDTNNRSNLVFTSGSEVQVTGSLNVQGPANITGNIVTQGSINVTGGITGSLEGTASYALSAPASPGGSNKQIQFNNAGVTDGAAAFIYDVATNTVDQGSGTTIDGGYAYYSHVEGLNNIVKSSFSHVEGNYNTTIGSISHAEGTSTKTGTDKGYYATQVLSGIVLFDVSYANITGKFFTGNYISIYAPGAGITTTGTVLGRNYVAGQGTYVTSSLTSVNIAPSGPNIVCINASTQPSSWTGDTLLGGNSSHTEGYQTITTGDSSHAEGFYSLTTGFASHAEGICTKALGAYTHAEGYQTTALGESSHAEGSNTLSSGNYSHAEGNSTQALGVSSHAEGTNTFASASFSHAEGFATYAAGIAQHVQGQYNQLSSAQSAFIIGNGINASNRRNLVFASGSQFQITGSILVTGSAAITGGITGSLLGTASFADLAYAIPGGTDTQIQYNSNGVLAGTTNLTWNSVNNTLNGTFVGDGSQLTGLVSPTAQFATSASHAIQADNAIVVTGYNYIQSASATTWTVTHNLNNQYPIVQVYNTDNIMIVPEEIQGTNANTTTIQFSFAMAGYARIL